MITTLFYDFFPDVIGCFGAIIILLAYFLLQTRKLKPESFTYSILNFFGALMLLFSLLYTWNLPAVIIEVAWILISLFGFISFFFPKLAHQNAEKR